MFCKDWGVILLRSASIWGRVAAFCNDLAVVLLRSALIWAGCQRLTPGTRGRCTCAHEALPPPGAVPRGHERPRRQVEDKEGDENKVDDAVAEGDGEGEELQEDGGQAWWASFAEQGAGCDAEAVVARLTW